MHGVLQQQSIGSAQGTTRISDWLGLKKHDCCLTSQVTGAWLVCCPILHILHCRCVFESITPLFFCISEIVGGILEVTRKAADVTAFSAGFLSYTFASRLESAREHSQTWDSCIGLDCQESSSHGSGPGNYVFQAMPGHSSSSTVFLCKVSVAMVGYKITNRKMCMVWSVFKRYVTTVNSHQQNKWIISSTVTSGWVFEAHIYEDIWPTNSTRHLVRSFSPKLSLSF